ncbi:hypothetical protein LTR95_009091 [Oleoguttula sp. CCFEE 5521]
MVMTHADTIGSKLEPAAGYVEIMDFDWQALQSDAHPMNPATPLPLFCTALDHALGRRGTPLRPHDRRRQLEVLGYDQIQHRIHRVPLSSGFPTHDMSDADYRAAQHANLECHVRDLKLLENVGLELLVDGCGWSENQARGLIGACERFVVEPTNFVTVPLHVWTARRPGQPRPAAATQISPRVRVDGPSL